MNYRPKEVNIAAAAELIGDPSRAAMLDALLGKPMLAAGELAYIAGISPQTASTHLAKLVEGGFLRMTTQGRHRYYGLASPEVAHALEALAVISPPAKIRTLRQAVVAEQLHFARTCYDHLAGKLGVAITQALLDADVVQLDEVHNCYHVTEHGSDFLSTLQLDLETLRKQRRAFARPCLDWSERRYHLAGALGAALTTRFLELKWIERHPTCRAIKLTETGRKELCNVFGDALQLS